MMALTLIIPALPYIISFYCGIVALSDEVGTCEKSQKNITGSYTEVHLELNGSQKTLQGSRWQYLRLIVKFDNPETMQLFLYFNQFKIFY